MDNVSSSAGFTQHSCMGGCVGGETGDPLPTLQDVANYNNMTPEQQIQQRQSLQQAGAGAFGGVQRQPAGFPTAGAGSMIPVGQTQQTAVSQIAAAGQQAGPGGQTIPIAAPSVQYAGDSLQYLNGFLRTQIGRPVLVTFLVGTNTLTDRSGTLLGVGINYILINETQTDDVLACDFYNIKFIRFYY